MIRAWQARWRAWLAQRHPRSDTLVLTQRNVYILPTSAGCLFAVLLVVLLLASVNYQLNLGYLLTFLLAGATAASIHTTHAVLRDLEAALQVGPARPADEPALVAIQLRDAATAGRWLNRQGRTRHSLTLQFAGAAAAASVWTAVPAGGSTPVQLSLTPGRRGWHALPDIRLETRFPFGLFRAWTVWRPAAQLLAWPVAERPAPPLPALPLVADAPDHQRRGAGNPTDGFGQAGVRPWRRGDAAQQILWKKSAQSMAGGGDPISREALPPASPDLLLDWQAAGAGSAPAANRPTHPAAEQRLSRLTAWVLSADALGARYALRLPGNGATNNAADNRLDSGPAHRLRCLERLATWGQGS